MPVDLVLNLNLVIIVNIKQMAIAIVQLMDFAPVLINYLVKSKTQNVLQFIKEVIQILIDKEQYQVGRVLIDLNTKHA
jgi:hypothetical protein